MFDFFPLPQTSQDSEVQSPTKLPHFYSNPMLPPPPPAPMARPVAIIRTTGTFWGTKALYCFSNIHDTNGSYHLIHSLINSLIVMYIKTLCRHNWVWHVIISFHLMLFLKKWIWFLFIYLKPK